MKIDKVWDGPRRWHGQIMSSHGQKRALWECKHRHRTSNSALACALTQLGIAEATMYALWHPRRY